VAKNFPPLPRLYRFVAVKRQIPRRTSSIVKGFTCNTDTTRLRSGQCLGLEALLRWLHPLLGKVPPDWNSWTS
jgi:hypothetical protein